MRGETQKADVIFLISLIVEMTSWIGAIEGAIWLYRYITSALT